MLDCISESEFDEARKMIPDYCNGIECETDEEYSEYFAKVMRELCDYKVIKGIKEHLNIYKKNNQLYEDRDYYFIDLSFIKFMESIKADDKHLNHRRRIWIRNSAIRLLTIYLME